MLLELPPELLLLIVENLSLRAIAALLRTCKRLTGVIEESVATVYRQAAVFHGYVYPEQSLQDAVTSQGNRWLEGVQEWKELCKQFALLDSRWEGKETSPRPYERTIHGGRQDVYQIKIDEEEQTIINTSRWGGLTVSCTETGNILWGIKNLFVKSWAHLEYSNGLMIFDRQDDSFEVWVRASKLPELGAYSRPHPSQKQARFLPSSSSTSRGVYVPFSVLQNPSHPLAFRFVFPFLLVASRSTVNIWNILTHTVVESFSYREELGDYDPDLDDGDVHYVELGTNHVFICVAEKMLIFERSDSNHSASSLEGAPSKESEHAYKARHAVYELPGDLLKGVYQTAHFTWSSPIVDRSTVIRRGGGVNGIRAFTAVHVSPDGRDLVAIAHEGTLFYVRDFVGFCHQTSKGSQYRHKPSNPQVWALHIGKHIRHSAFDGSRIVLDSYFHRPGGQKYNRVHVIVLDREAGSYSIPTSSIHHISSPPSSTIGVSCIQMTRTSVWYALGLTMDGRFDPLCPLMVNVDFTPSAEV